MKSKIEGDVIWKPSQLYIEKTLMHQYMNWLKEKKGLTFVDYNELWKWSVEELEDFWASIWDFNKVKAFRKYDKVLEGSIMMDTKWFTGSRLNYAENVLLNTQGDKTAIYFYSETIKRKEISWNELYEKVASLSHSLKELGVKPGDRVASYMPNIPETIIAFLAVASIGAIWSSCSPDFGANSVSDRFKQIEPVVLFAVDGYQYNGKLFDRSAAVSQLQRDLGDTLKHTILVNYIEKDQLEEKIEAIIPWDDLLTQKAEMTFESVPFDHPLWIVYSSGTTGMPKPIVHGHGGMLLEHLKYFSLHKNLKTDDTVFQFTTTGWVMWNLLVGSLLTGAAIVLYDGSPSYPNSEILWELTEDSGITYFGTSAPFIISSLKQGVKPKEKYDLSKLKVIDSTGAPLTEEGYLWIYENVNENIWLCSSSGGTDVGSGFVGGVPILPVRIGEIQGRQLGVLAEAFDEEGNSLVNEVGELVITKPMPSMPLYFWNDDGNERYYNSYYDVYPNVWKHGDWIRFDEEGSSVIYGRSDSTINRSGVRMGTSDIYRIVEGLDSVIEGLMIDLEVLGRTASLYLFVVLKQDQQPDEHLEKKIKDQIRAQISPRFMPDKIYQVEQIPKTLNGKKMEVPIRKLLLGFEVQKVINPDSMINPESLPFFIRLADKLNTKNKEKLF